jgi:hypothetical protein
MKRQVIDLMSVQELDAQLEELGAVSRPEQEPAGAPAKEALRLRAKRARLAKGLSAELLDRYTRLRQRYPRAVVETRRGVCLGCFTKRPTSMASRAAGLDTCERCGRILFQAERTEAPTASAGTESPVKERGRGRPRGGASPAPRASRPRGR